MYNIISNSNNNKITQKSKQISFKNELIQRSIIRNGLNNKQTYGLNNPQSSMELQ